MLTRGKVVPRLFYAALILCAGAVPSRAKVIFTGYADMRYVADAHGTINGTPAALNALSAPGGNFESRGFSADALGLFATTELREDTKFLMDLTFRNVGQTVGKTQIQYAYVDYSPYAHTELKGGRVTLPFGYYNENRFYAFQRDSINSPFFQSGILGLPIADWGLVAQQRVPMSLFTLEASAYTVNGYGHVPGQASSFRDATVPGGLSISNNLGATDGNHKQAVGGRLRLTQIAGTPTETGVSFYEGLWNAGGTAPLQLGDVHLHTKIGGLDFLTEGLWMDVHSDQGFVKAIGDSDYHTWGFFATASHPVATLRDMPLLAFLQTEYYRTCPRNGDNRETLRSWSGGLTLKATDNVTFKGEYLYLYYFLPYSASSGSVYLTDNQVSFSAVLTF